MKAEKKAEENQFMMLDPNSMGANAKRVLGSHKGGDLVPEKARAS